MKIFILFLFCSMTVNSQYFEFDSMTIYSTKFEQNESKTMIYTNSKNDLYYLKILAFSNSIVNLFVHFAVVIPLLPKIISSRIAMLN